MTQCHHAFHGKEWLRNDQVVLFLASHQPFELVRLVGFFGALEAEVPQEDLAEYGALGHFEKFRVEILWNRERNENSKS